MLKKILNILKRIILAGFALYAYNLMAAPLDLIIPINVVTMALLFLFGIPAIPFLALALIIIF
jgi:hypothetical protein